MPRLPALFLSLALAAMAGAAPAMGQGSAAALARWTLVAVPPDALVLAQNDADALRALQSEGLRPDVRVVSDPDSVAAYAGAWATSERPIVGTLLLDPEVFGRVADATVSAAAYQRPASLDEPPFDLAAAEAAADAVRGADFAGPPDGIVDLGGVVLFGLLQTAVSHAQAGDRSAAERAYARAARFARDAGHADDPLVRTAREWIDAALMVSAPAPAAPAATPDPE